jgi:hypothetical protein
LIPSDIFSTTEEFPTGPPAATEEFPTGPNIDKYSSDAFGFGPIDGDRGAELPGVVPFTGFVDRRSDYLLWRASSFGAGMRKDLAAQRLMGDILAASVRA